MDKRVRTEATMTTTPARRRFTVDEYECMGRAGIFHEDDRVELLEGVIYEMTPIGARHFWCVNNAVGLLSYHTRGRAIVSVQNPIRLSTRSEPQPDIVLFRVRPDYRTDEIPGAPDVLLLIEVSDTSLTFDRRHKLPSYAAAGIPEVWIVDLTRERIEVYRQPTGRRYQQRAIVERGGVLTPLAFPDLAIACDDILP